MFLWIVNVCDTESFILHLTKKKLFHLCKTNSWNLKKVIDFGFTQYPFYGYIILGYVTWANSQQRLRAMHGLQNVWVSKIIFFKCIFLTYLSITQKWRQVSYLHSNGNPTNLYTFITVAVWRYLQLLGHFTIILLFIRKKKKKEIWILSLEFHRK